MWQDDEVDHPESIACPVLVSPEVIRRFVEAERALKELPDRMVALFPSCPSIAAVLMEALEDEVQEKAT